MNHSRLILGEVRFVLILCRHLPIVILALRCKRIALTLKVIIDFILSLLPLGLFALRGQFELRANTGVRASNTSALGVIVLAVDT